MEYKLEKNVRSKVKRSAATTVLPLRNLPIAKEVQGELVGDPILIKGVRLEDVSTKIYNQAKRQRVKVSLVSADEGVRVYRVQMVWEIDGEKIPQSEVNKRAKEAGFMGRKELLIGDRLDRGVGTWRELLGDPTADEIERLGPFPTLPIRKPTHKR